MNVRVLLIQLMLTIMVVTAMLVAYHRLVVVPSVRYGVVDVAEVYRLKEKQLVDIASKPNLTEEQKKQATSLALDFGKQLPVALAELAKECNCLVFARHALAANTPDVVDLTPLLRSKIGI